MKDVSQVPRPLHGIQGIHGITAEIFPSAWN